MSSDGTYSGRGSRRADRDAPAVRRASAGAAAGILIVTALLGFGGGALFGNASGGADPQTPAAVGTEGAGDTAESPETTPSENADQNGDEAGAFELTIESPKDGGTARAGTGGDNPGEDIEFTIATNPAMSGLLVELQRSLDGGATWEPFGADGQVYTLGPDGSHTTSVWSGRVGENQLRVVHVDDNGNEIASDPIAVELVAGDGDGEGEDDDD